MKQSAFIFDPNNAIEEVEVKVASEFVIKGEPITHVWRCFKSEDGKVQSGFWTCKGGSFFIPSHTSNEMCTILEGEATVEMENGITLDLKPNDVVFIPFGIKNIWHVPNYVRKSYMCSIPN